ncbi:hypothetical protein [Streptomyces roseolus]|uniref:hypothetical protein n=1 Tax=Streptomyces roseolus TaxID=67358 RepID=UPI0036E850BA
MTTHPSPPSYGRPLLLGLALLLAGAAALLHPGTTTPAPPPPATRAQPAAAHPATPAGRFDRPSPPTAGQDREDSGGTAEPDRTPTATATAAAAGPGSVPSDQPVSGDGPAGDFAIQRLLDRTTPTDLPPSTARHLTRLATRVWIAETTGAGRTEWPRYFTGRELRAPYHDVRVQAATAHRNGRNADRAEVLLVWAGADAAGEFRDGRTAHVLLERHHNEWRPVR